MRSKPRTTISTPSTITDRCPPTWTKLRYQSSTRHKPRKRSPNHLALVENHDLGDERLDVPGRRETAGPGKRAKVLSEIADVIGLVIVLRKELQHAVVIRLVPGLQRVEDHEAPAGLEHPRDLGKDRAAHGRRQLV